MTGSASRDCEMFYGNQLKVPFGKWPGEFLGKGGEVEPE